MCLYNDALVPLLISTLDEWNVIKDLAKLVASYLLCTAGHCEWDERGANYSIGCACTEERQFKGFRLVEDNQLLGYSETTLLDPTLKRAVFDSGARELAVVVYMNYKGLCVYYDAECDLRRLDCGMPKDFKAIEELLGL